MGFFKTLFTGYRLMYQDLTTKHSDLLPRAFSGCGTGLMMIGSAVMAKTGLKDNTRDIIAECDAAIAEAEKHIEGEKKPARVKRIFKAKVTKGWKVVKAQRHYLRNGWRCVCWNRAWYFRAWKAQGNQGSCSNWNIFCGVQGQCS